MKKARSRLGISSTTSRTPIKRHQFSTFGYLRHLPTALLAGPFYSGCYYIFTQVHPSEIKSVLVVNSYLPLQIPFLMANSLFFSYLFLNTRRGIETGVFLFLILFIKFQEIVLEIWLVGLLLIAFVIIESVLTYLIKKKSANISQKPSSQKKAASL